jgi:hypothetical protein
MGRYNRRSIFRNSACLDSIWNFYANRIPVVVTLGEKMPKSKDAVYKIVDVNERDAAHEFRHTLIGMHGHFRGDVLEVVPGYLGGDFFFADPISHLGTGKNVKHITFLAIKVEPL